MVAHSWSLGVRFATLVKPGSLNPQCTKGWVGDTVKALICQTFGKERELKIKYGGNHTCRLTGPQEGGGGLKFSAVFEGL